MPAHKEVLASLQRRAITLCHIGLEGRFCTVYNEDNYERKLTMDVEIWYHAELNPIFIFYRH